MGGRGHRRTNVPGRATKWFQNGRRPFKTFVIEEALEHCVLTALFPTALFWCPRENVLECVRTWLGFPPCCSHAHRLEFAQTQKPTNTKKSKSEMAVSLFATVGFELSARQTDRQTARGGLTLLLLSALATQTHNFAFAFFPREPAQRETALGETHIASCIASHRIASPPTPVASLTRFEPRFLLTPIDISTPHRPGPLFNSLPPPPSPVLFHPPSIARIYSLLCRPSMSSNATLSTPSNGAQIKASRTRGASHIVSCLNRHCSADSHFHRC